MSGQRERRREQGENEKRSSLHCCSPRLNFANVERGPVGDLVNGRKAPRRLFEQVAVRLTGDLDNVRGRYGPADCVCELQFSQKVAGAYSSLRFLISANGLQFLCWLILVRPA